MNEILNSLIGRIWDTEGNLNETVTVSNWSYPYQGQCVSLIKAYFKKLYGIPLNFGNAIDYYNNMSTNGILNYCDWITSNPQNGDIAVTHCVIDGVDYGHVMIYYNGDYISQNVDSEPHAYIYPNYWRSQIIGWFRPKVNLISEEEIMKLANLTFSFDYYNNKTGKTKTFVYSGEDNSFTKVNNSDELVVLQQAYKACNGTDMPHFNWQTIAPYPLRLFNLVTREQISKYEEME